MLNYQPPSKDRLQGRPDEPEGQRFHQIIQTLDLNQSLPDFAEGSFALIGFANDQGIERNFGRPGASKGPMSIRKALSRLPVPQKGLKIFDAGDITSPSASMEQLQESLAEAVSLLLSRGALPIILGGGHELTWGHYLGIKKASMHNDLSFINFDAHFDIRPLGLSEKGHSGTSFMQIAQNRKKEGIPFHYTCIGLQQSGNTPALFEAAKLLNITTILARDIHLQGLAPTLSQLKKIVEPAKHIHLSLCMDVFSSAYAPGVSAPQPLGLTPWQVIPLLEALISSRKVLSIEIAEVSPPLDIDDSTSRLAANLIYFLTHKS